MKYLLLLSTDGHCYNYFNFLSVWYMSYVSVAKKGWDPKDNQSTI